MKREEIERNLCEYDKRNPDFWEDPLFPSKAQIPCACDNCFNGRHKLAEEAIKYMDALEVHIKGVWYA